MHLILDNKPYKPIYDAKVATKLSELPSGDAIAEGDTCSSPFRAA